LSDLVSRGDAEMSVRHAFDAGKIALPPRSPLPLPSAVKVTEDPAIAAVTDVARKVPSSVQRTLARPLASVLLDAALNTPFPCAALHITVAPLTGAPADVRTVTTSGKASIDDNVPCCPSPLVFAITFACNVFPPDVSGPGVVGVAAAHAMVATNSTTAGAVLMMRIERRGRRDSLRPPGPLIDHVGRRSARVPGNLILVPPIDQLDDGKGSGRDSDANPHGVAIVNATVGPGSRRSA
jgi:hypothetical protein